MRLRLKVSPVSFATKRARIAALLLVASAVCVAKLAFLAQGNDRSSPTGGRSALMGNTGVALAEDGAAPFLNPATIVRIKDQSLAFSVNFFTFGLTSFRNWHQPGAVDQSRFGNVGLDGTSINTNGFNVLPSTLCLFFTVAGVTAEGEATGVLHKGRQKLAACVGSLEASNLSLGALAFNGAVPGGVTPAGPDVLVELEPALRRAELQPLAERRFRGRGFAPRRRDRRRVRHRREQHHLDDRRRFDPVVPRHLRERTRGRSHGAPRRHLPSGTDHVRSEHPDSLAPLLWRLQRRLPQRVRGGGTIAAALITSGSQGAQRSASGPGCARNRRLGGLVQGRDRRFVSICLLRHDLDHALRDLRDHAWRRR